MRGDSLGPKNLPSPPESLGGGISIFPRQTTPLNDQRVGAVAPTLWKPTRVVLFQTISPAPALRSGGRARRTPRPLQSKAEGSSLCLPHPYVPPGCHDVQSGGFLTYGRTAWGGFQGEGGRSPPPLVGGRGVPRGGRIETPSLWWFLGSPGGHS